MSSNGLIDLLSIIIIWKKALSSSDYNLFDFAIMK